MAVPFAAILSGAGGLVSAYGNYRSSMYEAYSMERESLLKNATAREIRFRADINIQDIKKKGKEVRGEQIAQIAGSGRGLSSTTAFAILEQTARDVANEVVNERRDSEYRAAIEEMEAQNLRDVAKSTRKGATIALFGDLLGAGASTARSMPGGKKRG